MQFRAFDYRILFFLLIWILLGCYSKGGTLHRVESGETLQQISHRYQVKISKIVEANPHLLPNQILAGQKLLIPGRREVYQLPKEPLMVENEEKTSQKVFAPSLPKEPKLSLNFGWPFTGSVIAFYDRKKHPGIDISLAPKEEIRSIADGKVVYVGEEIEGYGKLIIVRNHQKIFSIYALVGTILVKKGDPIRKGETLALGSEETPKPFFHLEIRQGRKPLDPLKILPFSKK